MFGHFRTPMHCLTQCRSWQHSSLLVAAHYFTHWFHVALLAHYFISRGRSECRRETAMWKENSTRRLISSEMLHGWRFRNIKRSLLLVWPFFFLSYPGLSVDFKRARSWSHHFCFSFWFWRHFHLHLLAFDVLLLQLFNLVLYLRRAVSSRS